MQAITKTNPGRRRRKNNRQLSERMLPVVFVIRLMARQWLFLPPFWPPLREDEWSSFFPRPEPLFFPPSFHSSAAETVAPLRGLTQYGATTDLPYAFCKWST